MKSPTNKTKAGLIAEVKKLQRKADALSKKTATPALKTPKDLSEKWADIFKYSANIVAVVDRQLNIIDINTPKKSEKQKVIGRKAYDFNTKESQPTIKKAITEVFKTGKIKEYTSDGYSLKGEVRHHSCRATPLMENGKVIAVIVEATDITRAVEAQALLKQSEEKFRMLAENAVDVIYRFKVVPVYECEYISPSVKTMVGYDPEEYYKDPAFPTKIIHPEDLPILEQFQIAQQKRGNKPQEPMVLRSITKDKRIIWTESVNKPIFDSRGRLIAIEGITREITERKKTEETLEQSQQDLFRVLNNINELVYYVEFLPKGKRRIKYLGEQAKRMLGVSHKEFTEDPDIILKRCHKDDISKIREGTKKLRETRQPQLFVYRFLNQKKKDYVWLEERVTPQLDANGKHIGNFGIVRDVTDQIIAGNQLRDSEEKFRMLAENALDVVYRFSFIPEPHYEYVSPSILNMSGYTPEEFYADSDLGFKIIHPQDKVLLGDSEKLVKERSPVSDIKAPKLTFRWVKKDGTVIWTETVNTPIKNKNGKLIAVEGISRDITFEKEGDERFKVLSNVTFEGIVFSENGKIIDANDQFLKMYGFASSKEFIGKHIIHDFVVEEQRLQASKYIRLPKSEAFEVQTKRKDGTIITVEVKGQNIPYFGRSIKAIAIYNITQHKKNEFDLKESERILSTLMNNLPGMVYRCRNDAHWTMDFISNGCVQLTGYAPKDLINNNKRSFASIVHQQDTNLGKEEIARALKAHAPFEIQYRIITASGEPKWVWEKGEGVFSESGELLFIEGFITDVNDKKEYELEITRSRENYKSLVDYSPDGVFIHINGKVVFANPSALSLAGIQYIEDAYTYSIFDFLLPEYKEYVQDRLKKVLLGNPQEFLELKIRSVTGEIKEVETKPILIKFNGEDAILTVIHDISTQKQLAREQMRAKIAEEANELLEAEIAKRKIIQSQLQESQKYTRLLIDSSLDVICASDKDGYITEFNKAAQQTFGYTLDEIIGKHGNILYPTLEQRKAIVDEQLMVNGSFSGEILNIRKNGEQFTSFLSASVLKNEKGELVGVMGVSRDISELKKAEEKLKEQSAKLNAVFESSSHVIWTLDRNFLLTSFNKNFARFYKRYYNVDVYIGLNMIEGTMVSTGEYNKFWVQKDEAVLRGESQHFETKFVDSDGNIVWREVFLNPIYDEKGIVKEISGIGNDITEKKLAEEKIRQSLQEKEVLLKEVHHRVKNNLQVISSILNLQSSNVKDERVLNVLKESQNRIKSMAFIHESLYQTKDFTSINFSDYVVNLSKNLMQSYSNYENEIKLNLDIQNVFLNLDLAIPCGLIINEIVSNALKYAFVDKTEDAEIKIKMELNGERLILVIGDNGIGLPKSIDYRNTESLGLQLVVTLTDQLNGKIELDSNNGTTYTLAFKHNQIKKRI